MPGGRWLLPLGVVITASLFGVGAFATGVIAPGAPPLDVRDARFDPAGEVIGEQLADEGNTHIPNGQRARYVTVPPASGPMWGQTAPWGIRETPVADETAVHNLEHGGIVISYKGLSAEDHERLTAVTRVLKGSGFSKVILHPYPPLNDAGIVVTAWRRQLRLTSYDEVAIVKFVRAHYESPEAPEPKMRA